MMALFNRHLNSDYNFSKDSIQAFVLMNKLNYQTNIKLCNSVFNVGSSTIFLS